MGRKHKKNKKKEVNLWRGKHFIYHCNTCFQVIVAECQCDEGVPVLIDCLATPTCKGKMIRVPATINANVPPTVYAYIWTLDDDGVLSLIEKPGHPRIKVLFLAMHVISQARKKHRK